MSKLTPSKNGFGVDKIRFELYTLIIQRLLTQIMFLIRGALMKLLRITAEGLPRFKEKLDICFYAQQRVSEEQKDTLYPLFSNIYI